jgi:predicted amidophosphoribosyltransferase
MGYGFWPILPWWGFGWVNQWNTRPCPQCTRPVPSNARYCPWCRAEMGVAGSAQAATCPECNAATLPGAVYCHQCSAKLPANECASCHASISPQAKFCSECGKSVR